MRANGTDGQYRYVDQDIADTPNVVQATWRPPPDGSSVDRNEKFKSTINCNVRLASPTPAVITVVCHSQSNLVQTCPPPPSPCPCPCPPHSLLNQLKSPPSPPPLHSYCDGGKNYKILENLLLSMDIQNYIQRTNFGCPLKET